MQSTYDVILYTFQIHSSIMSLRFVTRKLKTQTLGDDDADVETDNTGVDQPGATNQNREKTEVSICISTKSTLLFLKKYFMII